MLVGEVLGEEGSMSEYVGTGGWPFEVDVDCGPRISAGILVPIGVGWLG